MNNEKKEKELWRKVAGVTPPEKHGEYWSCGWLEGGLAIRGNWIRACCAENAPVFEMISDENIISLKNILITRKEIVNMLNTDATSSGGCSTPSIYHVHNFGLYLGCSKCQFLCKKRWEPKEYLFDYITTATSELCNLQCTFCDLRKFPSPKYISCIPFFRNLIENKYLSPHATVNVSGGEPVMNPEFNELIDLISPNIGQLKIFSNGTIYSESLLKSLNFSGTSLILSLDAADREIYRRIKGKDLCDIAWDNAAKYASVGKERVLVKMIINEDNINDIEGFVGRAQRNNILNLHYDLDKNETLTEKISDDKFSKYTQAIAYFKLACLKNNIIYSNAQAGCTKEIDEESERILKEKAQEIGIAVRSCILQCQHNSFKVGDNLDFYVDFTGYDPKNLEFRFFVKFENMDWRELQGYSPRRKCRWKPDRSGNYSICAYIRYNDFSLPFLDYSQMEICIS